MQLILEAHLVRIEVNLLAKFKYMNRKEIELG